MQVIHFDKSIAYLCITPAIVFAFPYFVNCEFFVCCANLHVYYNERRFLYTETIESNSFSIRRSCGKSQEMVDRAEDFTYSHTQVVLR